MNEIVDKLLLAADKFIGEMHLKQPGFTNSGGEPLIKNKERIKKIKETGDWWYIYQNELYKACFQYDMTYGDFKDLNRGTTADKVLRDKAFNIAKSWKYDGYQLALASVIYQFSIKKTSGGTAKNEIVSNT